MLISKKNLAVLAAVAKFQENIYSLTCVYYDAGQKCLYASDGHCLYRSNLDPSSPLLEGFPEVDIRACELGKSELIPGKLLAEIEKRIPKSKALPVLQNIKVLSDEENLHLITADTESTSVTRVKKDDGQFPDGEKFERETEKIKCHDVVISIEQIEKLVKALKKNGESEVRLEIRGKDKPFVARTNDGFRAYIMPMVD